MAILTRVSFLAAPLGRRFPRAISVAAATAVLVSLSACRGVRHASTLSGESGGYAAAFDAARETLRARGFELERVDAASGTIVTQPKASAGLATPWNADPTTLRQSADDLLNHQQRRVRVTFLAPDAEHPPAADQPFEVCVEVVIDRVQEPGLRVPAKAPTLWTTTSDAARTDQGVGGEFTVPVARDAELEARIASEIESRLRGVR